MDRFKAQYKEKFKENFTTRIKQTYSREVDNTTDIEKYTILGELIRDEAMLDWVDVRKEIKEGRKQVFYFSMEFLLGRMLINNLINLDIYEPVKTALSELGIDLNELVDIEKDQGLGNGGLGRLAACFMDSIASLGYAGHGMCIRYNYGFFKQKFENGWQVEYPQPWLSQTRNVWEVRKPRDRVTIKYYGKVTLDENLKPTLTNYVPVDAVAYDMPLVGYHNDITNKLRLWSAEPNMNVPYPEFQNYESSVSEISDVLYPDDSTRDGKILRLKQQYFFSAAGLAYILKRELRHHGTLDNLDKHVVMQINDTHPAVLVPELMRSLMDEYNYEWEEAWSITTKTLAYTNHTILAEALEKWDVDVMDELLPRIYDIIVEINRRFEADLREKGYSEEFIDQVKIIKWDKVHMANLAIIGSFSVNGVAALHTDILKKETIKAFHELYPEKINNKTNGVTHRRWLLNCNPSLAEKITEKISSKWITDLDELKKLEDTDISKDLNRIKKANKVKLAEMIKDKEGIDIDPSSIFDIQIKRLHAYKRQLLSALHIMYVYNKLKSDEEFFKNFHPQTFIFGAKAAPSYVFAKSVIKLINSIGNLVNNDEETNSKLKVVFVQNYNVSYAEVLIPACDISEQISTAGKEASGTGNMKLQMNGAITIGTLDGANVEIDELVGRENIEIFGLTVDEVNELRHTYNPMDIYKSNEDLRTVINQIQNNIFSDANAGDFQPIIDDLLGRDEYFVLQDFEAYRVAQANLNSKYHNRTEWAKMALANIANSSFFTTDRTIQNYIDDIWKLDKLK